MEPGLGLGEARKADLTGQPPDDNSLTGLGVGVAVGGRQPLCGTGMGCPESLPPGICQLMMRCPLLESHSFGLNTVLC